MTWEINFINGNFKLSDRDSMKGNNYCKVPVSSFNLNRITQTVADELHYVFAIVESIFSSETVQKVRIDFIARLWIKFILIVFRLYELYLPFNDKLLFPMYFR